MLLRSHCFGGSVSLSSLSCPNLWVTSFGVSGFGCLVALINVVLEFFRCIYSLTLGLITIFFLN